MEKLSRIERKKQEKEESKQERKSGGLTNLRALSDLSRVVDFIGKAWESCKDYFSDLFL